MIQRISTALPDLYLADETAWLEAMSTLIERGRYDDLDYHHLGEYLADMARRDRREVESRLAILIAHILKWKHQPDRRSGSWRSTIVVQRQELAGLVERGVLRSHAEKMLETVYRRAVEQAAAETGLPDDQFPAACPFSLEELLSSDLPAEE